MGDTVEITITGVGVPHIVEGDQLRVRALFEDLDGDNADPDTVTVRWKAPEQPSITKVYGTDSEVVKLAAGDYAIDVPLDAPGAWYFRWEAAGDFVGAAESAQTVDASQVLPAG